jgi:hypothetical protein
MRVPRNLLAKNLRKKLPMGIDPALQRNQMNMGWGMGNQSVCPAKVRHRKYFNTPGSAAPESKTGTHPNQKIEHRPVKMSGKPTIMSYKPYQNAMKNLRIVSIPGMPRSRCSGNDGAGYFGII